MALFITKSNFMSGLQCQKRLWLEVREPNRATALAPAQQRIINQGNEVGRYARQQFPDGKLITGNSLDAIQETQQATLSGASCLLKPPSFLMICSFDAIFCAEMLQEIGN
jgi:hypothetical protein